MITSSDKYSIHEMRPSCRTYITEYHQTVYSYLGTMAEKKVYSIPTAKNLDGLYLHSEFYGHLFDNRIDDFRLKEGDDVLLATYPRTGRN